MQMKRRLQTFTVILDYRGGTYVRQVRSVSVREAIEKWARSRIWQHAGAGATSKSRKSMSADFLATPLEPIRVTRTVGVWCCAARVQGHLALLHIIHSAGA